MHVDFVTIFDLISKILNSTITKESDLWLSFAAEILHCTCLHSALSEGVMLVSLLWLQEFLSMLTSLLWLSFSYFIKLACSISVLLFWRSIWFGHSYMYERAMKHMENEGSVTRTVLLPSWPPPKCRRTPHYSCVCGQSQSKHGAVIRIAPLTGNRIISYWRKALPLYQWDAAEVLRLIKAKGNQKFARTRKDENIISDDVLIGLIRIKIQIGILTRRCC